MAEKHYNYLQPNRTLLDAFHVTEDEIKLNRSGQLSLFQRRRIWRDRLPAIMTFLSIWLVIGYIYTLFRNEHADASSTQCLAFLLVLSLLIAISMLIRAGRIMANCRVSTAIGLARLEERKDRYGGLFLYVDGRNFELKRSQYNLLRNGMALVVYYVEKRKRVLAVEPIVFHDVKT